MEFINEWNSIIPFHIDDSHLSNPTEDFMIKALTNYLKTLNFDVKIIQNNVNLLNLCEIYSITSIF